MGRLTGINQGLGAGLSQVPLYKTPALTQSAYDRLTATPAYPCAPAHMQGTSPIPPFPPQGGESLFP